MIEVPLYALRQRRISYWPLEIQLQAFAAAGVAQRYLAHKKPHPPRTLQ